MVQPRGCASKGWAKPLVFAAAGVALLVVPSPVAAQTLTEAFTYTYNTNPQLLAQRAALRATDESVPQALANWRPTVTFSGPVSYTHLTLPTN